MNASRRFALLLASVLSFGWLAAQTTTFTWTGNATNFVHGSPSADASVGANWSGGVAPTSSLESTVLEFGPSAGLSAYDYLGVQLPYLFDVRRIDFNAPLPYYSFYSDDGGTLRIAGSGSEGSVNVNGYYGGVNVYSNIELAGNQTWNINDGSIYVSGRISQSTAGISLTKTGTGTLFLGNSQNSFGSLTIQEGTLYVGASSGIGDSSLITGPVGSGTLTLADNTSLATHYTDNRVTLHNPISLGNNVAIGNASKGDDITLAGAITPQNTNTTVLVGVDGALFVEGGISDAAGGATTLTFTNSYNYPRGDTLSATSATSENDLFSVVVLSGTNTYTGATMAANAGVIFYTPGSLGATSSISAFDGYIGTGYSGGMQAILGKIDSPGTFRGALGFDTNPDLASTPTVFADNLDLSAFTPDVDPAPADETYVDTERFWGIGSLTSAILTGTITPPTGGNYVFGGGSGKLFVQSNLGVPTNSAGAGVRVRSFAGDDPITVWLQGDNSYTGKLYSDHSIVVLDSATALPAVAGTDTGRFQLDSGAYVGYTEKFTAGGTGTANADHTVTPAEFIARLAGTAYSSDSILGFDSAHQPNSYTAFTGRAIGAIDLRAMNNVFIGTTTHVHLTGTLTAPNAETAYSPGQLSVTGVNGGWLTIDTPLLAPTEGAPGVNALEVGSLRSDLHQRGYVELTSGDSTFAGGTKLNSGYLLLGASSTFADGVITKGPLGTGTIEVSPYYSWESPTALAATSTGVTLHNDLNFSYGSLQFGVPVTTDSESDGYAAQAYTSNGLTLNGKLTGTASMIAFTGNGTFTLNGDNANFSTYAIRIGDYDNASAPRVVANTNTALGSSSNSIYFLAGGDLVFGPNATAPSLGNLNGYYQGTTDQSFITLTAGSTLTVNQHQNWESWLYANIGGAPADSNYSTGVASAVNASLVKTGNGTLTLAGTNTYSGTTTIKGGLLLAGSNVQLNDQSQIVSGPFGSSTIVLDGGGVGAAAGFTLANPISFGTAGGALGGSGTIASAITAGTNVTIAPGNSPGQLTFTSGLTFAGGGVASFDISNFAGGAGNGWDQIVVSNTGTFAITATTANPFTIQINSWSDIGNTLGALTTDYSLPASLAIVDTDAPITGLIGDGQAGTSNLVLNTDNFTAYQPGEFSLSLSADSTALILNFTPVPEPSTYALFGIGLLAIAGSVWRRNRARRD